MEGRTITGEHLQIFEKRLRENEKAGNTVEKYLRDIHAFLKWKQVNYSDAALSKEIVLEYKAYLPTKYTYRSVNSMLIAINALFRFLAAYEKDAAWTRLTVKSYKVQQAAFRDSEQELTEEEYIRLLGTAKSLSKADHSATAQSNRRLSLILQTIFATGIRIGELRFITVEALKKRRVEIRNKGKIRQIPLTKPICMALQGYIAQRKLKSGSIFVTRNGKPLDRSNILRSMKRLAEQAGVDKRKVYPHNIRHLFAVSFYKVKKDLCTLAAILGHSNINTTRIYTAVSIEESMREMEQVSAYFHFTT